MSTAHAQRGNGAGAPTSFAFQRQLGPMCPLGETSKSAPASAPTTPSPVASTNQRPLTRMRLPVRMSSATTAVMQGAVVSAALTR